MILARTKTISTFSPLTTRDRYQFLAFLILKLIILWNIKYDAIIFIFNISTQLIKLKIHSNTFCRNNNWIWLSSEWEKKNEISRYSALMPTILQMKTSPKYLHISMSHNCAWFFHKYIHTFCFPSTSYYLSECSVFLAIWDMRCLAIKGLCVKNFLRTLTLFDPQCSENIFNNKFSWVVFFSSFLQMN